MGGIRPDLGLSICGTKKAVRAIVNPESNQGEIQAGEDGHLSSPLPLGGHIVELILNEKIPDIRRIAKAHGITRVRLFGSQASGVAGSASDLDLLVDLAPERDLLDLVAFKLALEDHLGCRVDVVTEASLSPYLRKLILREARPL